MDSRLKNLIVLILIFAFTMLTLIACSASQNGGVPKEMVGTWVGFGRNTMGSEFLTQRQIPFFLTITDKGEISGYVGDASITKTKVIKNPWWAKLVDKVNYKSVVELNGRIVNQESFSRNGGTFLFEKINADEILCTFTTTGNQVDAKNMVLPVKDIKLNHPD